MTTEQKRVKASEIVGMPELAAIRLLTEAGISYRIRCRDGRAKVLTCDYRADRVNLGIKQYKVVEVTYG